MWPCKFLECNSLITMNKSNSAFVIYIILGMISLSPSYGSMLGGTGVTVTGDDLVVNQNDVIKCSFDGVVVRGVYLGSQRVFCVSPLLERTGTVEFRLNISGFNSGESTFTSCEFVALYVGV